MDAQETYLAHRTTIFFCMLVLTSDRIDWMADRRYRDVTGACFLQSRANICQNPRWEANGKNTDRGPASDGAGRLRP